MCRLFAMIAAPHRVQATYWLIDAGDSLSNQSRQQPDGTGVGTFDPEGSPLVEKQELAAYVDDAFATEAKLLESTTFVAHVRHASTGVVKLKNTHPFLQRGRLFAHNGALGDLPRLEAEIGDYMSLVAGDTDSERLFALITKHIDERDGDVSAGIESAVTWAANALPIFSLNCILTTPTELWALRYPETHDLLVLERRPGGHHGGRHLAHASRAGTIRVHSHHLDSKASVIVATEAMDEDPGWRPLAPGELLHVDRHLRVRSRVVIDEAPKQMLAVAEIVKNAPGSQAGADGPLVSPTA